MTVFALNAHKAFFPPPNMADESGLLAIGGKLEAHWLLEAYSSGIFPWFNEEDPIMWWSPDPRSVIVPGNLKIRKSMRTYFNSGKFELRIDYDFNGVINNCQKISRKGQNGTWITSDMKKAYKNLHKLGYAHSFETWKDNQLVGGLYGVSLGKIFFGESMFSLISNASKFALLSLSMILKENGFKLLDCQIPNSHLNNMGCRELSRDDYLEILSQNKSEKSIIGNWGKGLIKTKFDI